MRLAVGVGLLLPLPLTPCQSRSKHTCGEADEEKWDEARIGVGGRRRITDIIHSNTAKLELVQR